MIGALETVEPIGVGRQALAVGDWAPARSAFEQTLAAELGLKTRAEAATAYVRRKGETAPA